MRLLDSLKFEIWWHRHKSALIELSKKGTLAAFNTVTAGTVLSDWYARNGYYFSGIGTSSSDAGISVNAETALEASAVYACVKIIAEDMGSLPFVLYRRSADRSATEKAIDHPLFPLLKNLPNPDISAGEFVETLTAHAALTGNGYAWKERSREKKGLVWLWPWMPYTVRQEQDRKGRIIYFHNEDGKEKEYRAEEVFHLKGFTVTGTQGDDIMQRARQVIGLTLAANKYASKFFAHSATPGVVVKFPNALSPESAKAFKEKWKEWFQGVDRSHEPAILHSGADITPLTPDNDKAQLVEQRKFQILEVCRLFRMKPHKLADLERVNYNSIEAENIDYLTQTLSPWRRRWKETVFRCLLSRDEQLEDRLYAEHDLEAFLRGDFRGQAEAFAKLLEKGVYSINEVRRWLNLNPVDGGDEHYVQLNMQAVAGAAQEAAKTAFGRGENARNQITQYGHI